MNDDLVGFINTYQRWLNSLSFPEDRRVQSIYFDLYPQVSKLPLCFRIMVPLSIRYVDCLPTFDRCKFDALLISGTFSPELSVRIRAVTNKQKDMLLNSTPDWAWHFLSHLQRENREELYTIPPDRMGVWKDFFNQVVPPYTVESVKWSLICADSQGRATYKQQSPTEKVKAPPASKLKAYCSKLYLYFFDSLACSWSKGVKDPQPPHFGWVGIFPHPRYCGLEIPDNPLLFKKPEKIPLFCTEKRETNECLSSNVNKLLSQGPYEVTIPLFSYTLFSVIKPFFHEYPSRLNDHQPYRTVAKALDKKICLSVSGTYAHQFSRLFCGAFMEYENGYYPAAYKRPNTPEAQRIHDGIVIYIADDQAMEPRLGHKQVARLLLRDACVLLLDTGRTKGENRRLHTQIPRGTSAPDLADSSVLTASIQKFAQSLVDWWEEERLRQNEHFNQALRPLFDRYYDELRHSVGTVHIGPLEDDEEEKLLVGTGRLSFKLIIDPFCAVFERCDKILRKKKNSRVSRIVVADIEDTDVKKIVSSRSGRYGFLPSILEGRPTVAALKYAKFYIEADALYKKYMPQHYTAPISYKAILKQLTADKTADPKKASCYAYLFAALQFFCKYVLKEGGAELEAKGLAVFQQLCKKESAQAEEPDYLALFSKCLSAWIEDGSIIPVRGVPPVGQKTLGWYDSKKGLIYLPYATYFKVFCDYCLSNKNEAISIAQSNFQTQVLYKTGVVTPKENGAKNRYLRCSTQIVVAPIDQPQAPKETVIKIQLARLMEQAPLSTAAYAKLQSLAANQPQRGRANTKKD